MTTLPEEAVKAAIAAHNKYYDDLVIYPSEEPTPEGAFHAALKAALPFLPVQGAVKADVIKLIERMAFGYEVMFEKLCHISGTSGADQSWYRAKAREATERLSPLHSIATESNKSVPGDCKRQYQDFMARILSALEPSAARELALEEAANRFDRIADIINRNLYHQQEKIKDAQYIAAEGSAAIRALSSPVHADAGKVEGDGWSMSPPKFHRYPYFVENISGKWCLCKHHGNGASHTISVHETAREARDAAPSEGA